jgi:hypothetical protein
MAAMKKALNKPNKPAPKASKGKGPAVSGGRVVTPSGNFGTRTKKGENLANNKFVRATNKADKKQ